MDHREARSRKNTQQSWDKALPILRENPRETRKAAVAGVPCPWIRASGRPERLRLSLPSALGAHGRLEESWQTN